MSYFYSLNGRDFQQILSGIRKSSQLWAIYVLYPCQKLNDNNFAAIDKMQKTTHPIRMANTRGGFICWLSGQRRIVFAIIVIFEVGYGECALIQSFSMRRMQIALCRIYSNVCILAFGRILWFDMVKSKKTKSFLSCNPNDLNVPTCFYTSEFSTPFICVTIEREKWGCCWRQWSL